MKTELCLTSSLNITTCVYFIGLVAKNLRIDHSVFHLYKADYPTNRVECFSNKQALNLNLNLLARRNTKCEGENLNPKDYNPPSGVFPSFMFPP